MMNGYGDKTDLLTFLGAFQSERQRMYNFLFVSFCVRFGTCVCVRVRARFSGVDCACFRGGFILASSGQAAWKGGLWSEFSSLQGDVPQ